MKINNLQKVTSLNTLLQQARASYQNNFKDKRNGFQLLIKLNNGCNVDLAPMEVLDLDLSMEGPIAALVDFAYRKKIAELEHQLRELGVDLNTGEQGVVL